MGLLRISGTDTFISEVSFRDQAEDEIISPELPPLLIQCTEQLIQYFQGERRVFELPLVQPGTAFQQEVWNELLLIPYGKTISYLDQARRLGDSKAIRAVANANGRNNIAIIVPCHRVIGADRSLTGYGGGLWRKKWLLEHEMHRMYGVQTLF